MRPVKDIAAKSNLTVKDLVKQFGSAGGFTATKLATAVDILNDMTDCYKFLSFPADIIATGTRGIIKDWVKEKKFDALITTCGTLDHDFARSYAKYYHGSFDMDDIELHKQKKMRLGNVLIPEKNYGVAIEKNIQPMFKRMYKEGRTELSTPELVWELGRQMKDKNSIIYWAYKNKIPVFVPGITDGAVGNQFWMFAQDHNMKIDILKDETMLSDIVFTNKKTGALIIGGGISKHHVIWWNQYKGGLDYAVYITTAQEWDGSLSGARTREAISWGKLKEKAKHITVEGDATVLLPIIAACI
jgi:deoxyhypusine synthase